MFQHYPHSLVHVPCYSNQCQTVWVHTAGPGRGPNGLPRLSADDKSHPERQSDQRLCYSHQSGFYENISRVLFIVSLLKLIPCSLRLLSSAENLGKKFEPKLGSTFCQFRSDFVATNYLTVITF